MTANHDPALGFIGPFLDWPYRSCFTWVKPGATAYTFTRIDWPAFEFWHGGRTGRQIFYAQKSSDVPSYLLTMPPYLIEYVEAHR